MGRVHVIVEEYRAVQAGRDLPVHDHLSHGPGELVAHGPPSGEPGTFASTYVCSPGAFVSLVAVGTEDEVRAALRAVLPKLKEASWAKAVVTPTVRVAGRPRVFGAVSGKHLLGVLELGEGRTLLLGACELEFHVVLVAGPKHVQVVRSGSIDAMRSELDVDPWVSKCAAEPARRGIAEEVRREHARMVEGAPERSLAGLPSWTAVVREGLRRMVELCLLMRPRR